MAKNCGESLGEGRRSWGRGGEGAGGGEGEGGGARGRRS